jgi:hypothetical protein
MDLSFYALGKDEGPALGFFNTLTVVKATAKQTANTFGLMEQWHRLTQHRRTTFSALRMRHSTSSKVNSNSSAASAD